MLPRAPNAVVFDMDGLLFDTEKIYQQAILAAAAEMGVTMTVEVFREFVGTPWAHNRARMVAHYGETYPAEELRTLWMQHFNRLIVDDLPMKPGVLELLDTIEGLGLPAAIATSSSHRTVQHHLAHHGLAHRFAGVSAQGDYAASKPAPDPFLKASEKLGVAPQHCLALEDSLNGVRSAAAAGMMTVMVPDLVAPTDDVRALCVAIAADLHEVRAMVGRTMGLA